MKIEHCAFELQADKGVEFFDYETNIDALTLTGLQVEEFLQWYHEGLCPVCSIEINEGEIICDNCFAKAKSFPARADSIKFHERRESHE